MRIRSADSGWPSKLIGRSGKASSSVSDQASAAALSSPLDALHALTEWQTIESSQGMTVRWPSKPMPIVVTLAPFPKDSTAWQETEICRLLDATLKQWEIAAQGVLRFTWDPTAPSEGDIQIQWASETTYGRDYELGHTDRTIQGKWIRQAVITLITDPAIDTQLTPGRKKERLYSTLLHELGHALGLEHLESERDVMHHRGWKNQALSPNDIRSLQALYAKPGFSL